MRTLKQLFSIPTEYHTTGDVGLEIEMEGSNLIDGNSLWRREDDDSLRHMPERAEYVLRKPLSIDKARKALIMLSRDLRENSATINPSVRAGVHVHINVQDLNIVQLFNFICLYLVLEELLITLCGPNRQGNLFCLRTKDAGFLLSALKSALRTKDFTRILNNQDLRYGSMNVMSLFSYGSLEFRSMSTDRGFEAIDQWACILYNLREIGARYESPLDIVSGFSGVGPSGFLDDVLGEDVANTLKRDVNYREMIYRGIRNAQDIAFCVDWDVFKNKVSKNPFKKLDW